jgi:hypothetical protein
VFPDEFKDLKEISGILVLSGLHFYALVFDVRQSASLMAKYCSLNSSVPFIDRVVMYSILNTKDTTLIFIKRFDTRHVSQALVSLNEDSRELLGIMFANLQDQDTELPFTGWNLIKLLPCIF